MVWVSNFTSTVPYLLDSDISGFESVSIFSAWVRNMVWDSENRITIGVRGVGLYIPGLGGNAKYSRNRSSINLSEVANAETERAGWLARQLRKQMA